MLLLTFDSEMAAINLTVKLKQFADFLCSALYPHFRKQMGPGLMLSKTSNSFQHSNQPSPNNVYGITEQLSSAEEVKSTVCAPGNN